MRKLFLLFALLIIPIVRSQAQVKIDEVFKSLNCKDDMFTWTSIDNNKDNLMWYFTARENSLDISYVIKEGYTADDLMISDPFYINGDGKYQLYFESNCTKGMNFSFLLYDEEGNSTVIGKRTCIENDTVFKKDSITFNCDIEGDYKLGVLVKDVTAEYGEIRIGNVLVTHERRPDMTVILMNEIKDGYRKTRDYIDIRLKNEGSAPAYNYSCYYTINGGTPVYYNTEQVGSLAGNGSTDFIKCKEPVKYDKYGICNIDVIVKCEGDTVTSNDTVRFSIDNREYAEMPIFEDFENIDYEIPVLSDYYYVETWRLENSECNEDYNKLKDWGNFMSCRTAESDSTEWMFMPPVKLEPGYYAVEFDYVDVYERGIYLEVSYGDCADYKSMVNNLRKIYLKGHEKTHAFLPFYISETQDCIVGFHTFMDYDFYAIIDNISIKPIDKPAEDVGIMPLAELYNYNGAIREGFTFEGINCDVENNSLDKVLRTTLNAKYDGKDFYNASFDIKPLDVHGELIADYDFPEIEPGRHIITATVTCENDSNPDNNTREYDIVNCTDPYLFYDFENGMPEGTQLIVADDGTSAKNPDNAAWYIDDSNVFTSESTKSLSTSTYVGEEIDSRADRWFILPPVYVGNNATDLVWEDYNYIDDEWDFEHKFERYQVLVSTTDTSLDSFKVVGEYKVLYGITLRRVRLDEFAGNNVHIAFRAYTYGRQTLMLDNIGLYGDFEEVHTSISKVAEGINNISIEGDMLNVNATADRIDIIDIDGRIIATANNVTSMNIASLSAGVYMARINIDGTINTVKFVR